jgi:beta-glucosidase
LGSEDGFLAAGMAAGVVKGAREKGVYTYAKHFALNDQETNRDTTDLITWCNEQAMRELYFVPFEAAVKDGGATAFMSSFNRVGTVWAGGDYNLLTNLLRVEWGFRGTVITDFNLTPYMNVDQMIRAGGDLNLSPSKNLSSNASATAVAAIRAAAKNILYTVANSNAMNGMGSKVVWGYARPLWVIYLSVADAAIAVLCIGWGALVFFRKLKAPEPEKLKKPKKLKKAKAGEAGETSEI